MEFNLAIQIIHNIEMKKKNLRDKAKQEGRPLAEKENFLIENLDAIIFDLTRYLIITNETEK